MHSIFNFQKAYAVCVSHCYSRYFGADFSQILDELIIAGELQESSKKSVLRVVCVLLNTAIPNAHLYTTNATQVTQSDSIEEQENSEDTMARLGSLGSRGP